MTYHQMLWASTHDWYNHCTQYADGTYIIWVDSRRPEGGLCPFTNHEKLIKWAGY